MAHVPGWAPGGASGGAAAPVTLHSGAHNKAYRVETRAGCYVLRLQPANGERLGAHRGREAALQAIAARFGYAPGVVYADPDGRCLVTEYAPGDIWTPEKMVEVASLERLAQLLGALHAIPPPAAAPFRLDALIRGHCERLSAAFPAERTALGRLADDCDSRLQAIGSSTRPAAIVHNDLHHSNIIDSTRLVLIDWEYAGVADPLFDLACVLAYYPGAQKMGAMLLECSGLGGSVTVAMLRTAAELFRTLSDLWTQIGQLDSES